MPGFTPPRNTQECLYLAPGAFHQALLCPRLPPHNANRVHQGWEGAVSMEVGLSLLNQALGLRSENSECTRKPGNRSPAFSQGRLSHTHHHQHLQAPAAPGLKALCAPASASAWAKQRRKGGAAGELTETLLRTPLLGTPLLRTRTAGDTTAEDKHC